MKSKRAILVLGAGIQGLCVALALRARGYTVTVIDRMSDLMLRASLRNEGKIHLGFVYANDASFQTSALMLRAALQFSPLLDEWLETPMDWRALTSTPFYYLVMRDSMLSPTQIHAHYAQLQTCFEEMTFGDARASYLGNDLRGRKLWQPAPSEINRWFTSEQIAECLETVELALDRENFRVRLKARLAAFPEITFRFGHNIETIERDARGFSLQGVRADGTRWRETAETVINCLWDGRLALDEQLGIAPQRAFVMRLKYRLLGSLPNALQKLPSLTMVLGRYGDIVQYPNMPTYFSWYPTCLRGWSQTLTPPPDWEAACTGKPAEASVEEVTRTSLAAFEKIIPGIAASRIQAVDGGIIYSWGETDIDDRASGLHTRYEIGFTEHDGYYSVDTGKFTCAPMHARALAKQLDG